MYKLWFFFYKSTDKIGTFSTFWTCA